MISRQKKDDNQLVLKLGLTVALWFAGFLCTRLGNKSTRPSLPPSDVNEEVESGDDADVGPGDSSCSETSSKSEHIGIDDGLSREQRDKYEQEIKMLRSTVTYLRERESSLEIQLFEYYGLKEQEMSVTDLQNQLEMSNIQARAHSLMIESLLSENKQLKTRVSNYSRVVDELEAARAKMKVLKSKLRSDAEQNKQQIIRLKQRVVMLDKQEKDSNSKNELQRENSDRDWRLEAIRLQEENENMRNERYGEVEELVYLRWVNACLRYELRNYNPPNGKSVAKELSKSLSPRSESKAKQLIMEYAEEAAVSVVGTDYDQWSPSQSFRTDSGSLADKVPKRLNFLGKLRGLIIGKDNDSRSRTHHKPCRMVRSRSFEDLGKAYSCIVQRRNSISTPTQNSTSFESMKPNLNSIGYSVSSSRSI